MKFYLISDNVDTEMGLRLVGIEGEVVHKRRDFLEVLETKMKDRSIGVILITTKLIELAPDVISEIKLKQQKPLLVEIPDRHGNSKIGETIDRYVSEAISSAEEKEILDEAKAIEQEAYNQLRGEAEIDAKHQLDKELAEISSKASIEASAQLEERLKKLVEKREEYVNTIFTEVKNKLVEFVNSSNYLEYLTSHVKAVSDEYQMTDCVLCVRKEDLKYADDLKKAYALPIEVEEGQQIQLGGFIIENKTTNVVVDESLDSNLEAQKDWFYKTSGLMIK